MTFKGPLLGCMATINPQTMKGEAERVHKTGFTAFFVVGGGKHTGQSRLIIIKLKVKV